ncbi:MAG TPA: polysaccharide deacetylase family protein [Nitrospirota bacterium]|nr:polysaccharide deacetylase family protein [Nitrospirota bacterium]
MSHAIILMYHNIGKPPKGVETPNLYVTPGMFKFQMWYLKRAGFHVVTVQDLIRFIQEGRTGGRMVALTFDDGYRDFYENAYPVLKYYGYPSTVFVTPGLMGRENTWDCMREKVRKPLMDGETVAEISRNNVIIGSHSMTHPSLVDISSHDVVRELTDSKREIEEIVKRPVDLFCYPYGKHNDRVREEVKNAGYAASVSTLRGWVKQPFDPFCLNRVPVKLTTNPLSFLHRLYRKY